MLMKTSENTFLCRNLAYIPCSAQFLLDVYYKSARHQPNAGSMMVHRRPRRLTLIQYWAVFYAGVSVSKEHTLTLTQRPPFVGPALASIDSTPGRACCLLSAGSRLALRNAGTTPNQHCIRTHVHQEQDMPVTAAVSSAHKRTGHSIQRLV